MIPTTFLMQILHLKRYFLRHIIEPECQFPVKLKRLGFWAKHYDLINTIVSNRHQTVVFNGQFSSWSPVGASVLQGLFLGNLFFLVYLNDLPKELPSNSTLIVDTTSIFSVVQYLLSTSTKLTKDVTKICE